MELSVYCSQLNDEGKQVSLREIQVKHFLPYVQNIINEILNLGEKVTYYQHDGYNAITR